MLYFLFVLMFFAVLVLITRPFTVIFHELGHAIPAILMTRQKVSIYIGSYGDPKKSLHFRIGLLEVWFRYNPFLWERGLCVPSSKQISINKQIIYTFTGPLASIVIAGIVSSFAFSNDIHDFLRIFLIIFIGSAIYDLFVNLTPSDTPVQLCNGDITYNDGYQLKQLFHYKKMPKAFQQGAELYDSQQYKEAAVLFNNILVSGIKHDNIYRFAISAFLQVKDFQNAKNLAEEFLVHGSLNSDDYLNVGLVYSHLEEQDKAIMFYDKSLQLNPHNIYSMNNKGFSLTLLNKFHEAIPLLDKAIEIDNKFAYSYNNRGLAKIKIGKLEDGLEDINISIQLDENNAYGYRNLGIYHLEKGEFRKALDLFYKAKELDCSTYMIEELIIKADM
jgi:Flp pilus assembly protein TadD